MDSDIEQLRAANQKLLTDLAQERSFRQKLEEKQRELESDRERSQHSRDELVKSVLLAEKRAQDAEDEQLRTEQELTTLMQQLQHQQQLLQARSGSADGNSSPMVAEINMMRQELQKERQRSEQLVASEAAALAEARSASQQLESLRQRYKEGSHTLAKSSSATSLGAAEAEGAGLMQRVLALKSARDRLIAALDLQASEVERLSAENASLAQAVVELRDVASRWEAQAQLGLAQSERLKDLLEESATWGLGGAVAATGSISEQQQQQQHALLAGEGTSEAAGMKSPEEVCAQLQRELLLEKARTAQLDLQVRTLCMELTKTAQRSGQLQHAVVPLLSGVERRLAEVLGMHPRLQFQPQTAMVES